MKNLTDEEVTLIEMTFGNYGKLLKLDDKLYGFLTEKNKIRLFNTDTSDIYEDGFELKYIGKYVILIGNWNIPNIDYRIISRNDFKTIVQSNIAMRVSGDIIYEGDLIQNNNIEWKYRRVFNLKGKQIGTIKSQFDITLDETDNENIYIVEERGTESNFVYSIGKYDKEKETFEIYWESQDFYVENIGYGLYKFFNREDYRQSYIYSVIGK